MDHILQTIYIKTINPLFKYIGMISERNRNIIVQIICFFFPVYMILFYSKIELGFTWTHLQTHIVGSIVIVLLSIFSLRAPLVHVPWRRVIVIPELVCGLGLIITGMLHPIGDGYVVFGFMLIFIYPLLYFVWSNRRDYSSLFDCLSTAMMFTGIAWFIICFIMACKGNLEVSPGESRIKGIIDNANLFSFTGMPPVCGALYICVTRFKKILWRLLSATCIGMGLSIIWLGQSRAALLICFVNILVTIYFSVRCIDRIKLRTDQIISILLIVVVSLTFFVLGTQARKIQISNEKYTNEIILNDIDDKDTIDRLNPGSGKDLDTFTSGRITIWSNYAKQLNLIGNDFYKADWSKLTNNPVRHAHNNFLEFGYRCGILVAIAFSIFEIIVALFALGYLFFNKKGHHFLLLTIMCVVMYAVMSVFDIATIPFERDAPCYFFFAITPMIRSGKI